MNIRSFLLAAGLLLSGTLHASDFLVSTDWLEKNLNDPKVRIIEVSVDPGVYERGHIPGAVNFGWHTDLVDPVRRDIVTPGELREAAAQSRASTTTPPPSSTATTTTGSPPGAPGSSTSTA